VAHRLGVYQVCAARVVSCSLVILRVFQTKNCQSSEKQMIAVSVVRVLTDILSESSVCKVQRCIHYSLCVVLLVCVYVSSISLKSSNLISVYCFSLDMN